MSYAERIVPSWAGAPAVLSKCTECDETYSYRFGKTTTTTGLCQKCNEAAKPDLAEEMLYQAAGAGYSGPKTKQPPTERQLERINELKDLPEFQPHLDWLLTAVNKGMLNTRGQAGIVISQMKKKLNDRKLLPFLTDGEIDE